MLKVFITIIFVSLTLQSRADKLLPLQTLRDQDSTQHCWAYAMSHLLESRALVRHNHRILINVEKDVKYWVDFERMQYIFRTKKDFPFTKYEGAWQIEYWEALIKHGKHIAEATTSTSDIWYQPMAEFTQHLPFMSEPRPAVDPTLLSPDLAKLHLTKLQSENEAQAFIVDYLNRWYGVPSLRTHWNGENIAIASSAYYILGADYPKNNKVDSVVLVKPVSDQAFGWVRYLTDRYWGYRYDSQKILNLVRTSLDNGWPVTFDNIYHAMTIVAYVYREENKQFFFAVADSVPGKITWYPDTKLLGDINLVTFFASAIPGELPPLTVDNMSILRNSATKIDQLDNVEFPPM
jgi:hypothetical protein